MLLAGQAGLCCNPRCATACRNCVQYCCSLSMFIFSLLQSRTWAVSTSTSSVMHGGIAIIRLTTVKGGACSRCTELSGRHERSLRTLRCGGGCQHGRFCSRACLEQAWPVHRWVCKREGAQR